MTLTPFSPPSLPFAKDVGSGDKTRVRVQVSTTGGVSIHSATALGASGVYAIVRGGVAVPLADVSALIEALHHAREKAHQILSGGGANG